jgi:2-polyprenyl-3-methyl-5-hydroxy-6-metoxy-1,4-benzoquinol methylase
MKDYLQMIFGKKKTNAINLKDTISSDERYKRSSLNQLQSLERILNQHGYSFSSFHEILDFGCGYGRLTRHFFELFPSSKIYGCDVQNTLIEGCKENFPKGNFLTCENSPPLNFPDKTFDCIFSFSIYTHLSEPNHIAWLKDMARMLKDKGVMIHSTHGYECLKRLQLFNPENLKKYNIPCDLNSFINKQNNYHYVVSNQNTPEYGFTIISKDYITENWEKYSGLKLCGYTEGAIEVNPEGCHDIVLLRKE